VSSFITTEEETALWQQIGSNGGFVAWRGVLVEIFVEVYFVANFGFVCVPPGIIVYARIRVLETEKNRSRFETVATSHAQE
jgi:hypothetical protein